MFCIDGGRPFVKKLKWMAEDALAIIAWGTCASWGCVQAAKPNPTQATPIDKVILDKPIIKVPGCPPIAEVMTGVVTYITTFGKLPELDRPKMFYSHPKQILPAPSFSMLANSSSNGTTMVLVNLQSGLQGPDHLQCLLNRPLERWSGLPDPVRSRLIGCSEEGFWDNGSFYDRLTNLQRFGVEANPDKVGLTTAGVVGDAIAAHAAVTAVKRVATKREKADPNIQGRNTNMTIQTPNGFPLRSIATKR